MLQKSTQKYQKIVNTILFFGFFLNKTVQGFKRLIIDNVLLLAQDLETWETVIQNTRICHHHEVLLCSKHFTQMKAHKNASEVSFRDSREAEDKKQVLAAKKTCLCMHSVHV